MTDVLSTRSVSSDLWEEFNNTFRNGPGPLPQGWAEVFGPLHKGAVDELVIVGQTGQSLDGRLATETGHSKYINGPEGLTHLHRLRSLVDVVVVGVGTAIADDPLLTVRQVCGPQPARVVIDPGGRLGADARMFADDGVPRLLITAQGTHVSPPPGVEVVVLPAVDGRISPAAIVGALADRGMRRMLIEGGANTISRFLVAGYLDRLHIMDGRGCAVRLRSVGSARGLGSCEKVGMTDAEFGAPGSHEIAPSLQPAADIDARKGINFLDRFGPSGQ
jgi:diaminohydroxyphosphoribosylaminopyrimidine deaminase/5-amino-6-(5-phosphoribosylamino)uracil reductase